MGRREPKQPSAAALAVLCLLPRQRLHRWRRGGRRAKLGEEATGLQDAHCQADLLSSAICCLKATAVTKAGPDTDGYQIPGILSYSHFTPMEKTARGTEQERTEVMGSPSVGPSNGPLTNTQGILA